MFLNAIGLWERELRRMHAFNWAFLHVIDLCVILLLQKKTFCGDDNFKERGLALGPLPLSKFIIYMQKSKSYCKLCAFRNYKLN